jgi:nucleotide-binding universal stress UspA family protein
MPPNSYKVLLPVDGSADALAAVRHALQRCAAVPGASFVLVNVQELPSLYEVVVAHDAERLDDVRRAAGSDLLGAAEALLDAAGADYETEVASGAAEHLIVELAQSYGCDVIVIGARGLGTPTDEGGLGPVALAVLQASPLPVTVVRAAMDSEGEAAQNGSGEGAQG